MNAAMNAVYWAIWGIIVGATFALVYLKRKDSEKILRLAKKAIEREEVTIRITVEALNELRRYDSEKAEQLASQADVLRQLIDEKER